MLFNNCRSRPHAELFGADAFYDLNQIGAQANMAADLETGQHCCVATPVDDGDIELAWYCFSHERLMTNPTEPSEEVRVFFGEWLGSETLPKSVAAATQPYSGFFNVHGHFKQWSAIRPDGICVAPAGLRV